MMGAPNLISDNMDCGLSYSVISYLKKLSQQVSPADNSLVQYASPKTAFINSDRQAVGGDIQNKTSQGESIIYHVCWKHTAANVEQQPKREPADGLDLYFLALPVLFS